MLINEKIAISTSKALLVPYEEHHVPKYHTWMQDPDIQEATASEPMTLEEEYENQQSWRTSNDKLTFIVCSPHDDLKAKTVQAKQVDSDDKMRGDINFFLYPYDDDEVPGSVNWLTGEIDIMIADKAHRGQKTGSSAVRALLVFLKEHVAEIIKEHNAEAQLQMLMVKLKQDNTASRALFERLGFVQQGEVNYFGEVMLVMEYAHLVKAAWLEEAAKDYHEAEYVK